jgi:hypothetical protein
MAASALEAAVMTVMGSYVAAHCTASSSDGSDDNQQQQQQQQQGPVQFAVLFKNRDSTAPKVTQSGQPKQQQKQQQDTANGSAAHQQQQPHDANEPLDKSKAINIAVAAVHECCKIVGGAKVNLSQPQVRPVAVFGVIFKHNVTVVDTYNSGGAKGNLSKPHVRHVAVWVVTFQHNITAPDTYHSGGATG